MEELDKKRRTRRVLRRYLSKLMTEIDGKAIDAQSIVTLEKQIKEKYDSIVKIDEDILGLAPGMDSEDAEEIMYNEVEEAGDFNLTVEGALFKLRNLMKIKEEPVDNLDTLSSISSKFESQQKVRANLPKLQIKRFSGKPQDWQEFWDCYKSAIHENDELSKIDKFSYLKYFLEEPARTVVAGFALAERNYDSAVELLTTRFAKPSIIKKAHIQAMVNAQQVYDETHVEKLSKLHDTIETHFRGLEAMGVPKDSYSSIIVPIIMEKIPEQVRISMIRADDNFEDWDIKNFLEALKKELSIRDHNALLFNKKKEDSKPKTQWKAPVSSVSSLHAGKRTWKGKCSFCLGEHEEEQCEKVKDPQERRKLLSRFGRCFLCLCKGHKAFACKTGRLCFRCYGKHHESICVFVNDSSKIKTNDQVRPDETDSSPSRNNVEVENNSSTACVGNVSGNVRTVLQTAQALVKGKENIKCRVLFDTGSQRTFVTKQVVERLALPAIRQEKLAVNVFGCKSMGEKVRDVVYITLCSLYDRNTVMIEAVVVDDIAEITNEHVEVVKREYPHLTNLWFSDVSCSQDSLVVDILIGTDYLWTVQESEIVRGEPNEPVAIKTKLGWVMPGPLKGKIGDSLSCVCLHVRSVDCLLVLRTEAKTEDKCSLDLIAEKLWDLDSLGIKEVNSVHEGLIDDIEFTGERYRVKLPWKIGHKPLPNNETNSLCRLKSQFAKLQRDPDLLCNYDAIIKEQLNSGIVEEVDVSCRPQTLHYMYSQAFMRSFRRFIGIYDCSSLVVSDSAETFIKLIVRFLKKLQGDQEFYSFVQEKQVTWKFNLERSPWWGGFFERLVGSTKTVLRKVIGNSRLSYDELSTVLAEVKSVLNARPLTYVYDEVESEPLTPNHLLFGRKLATLGESDEITDTAENEGPAKFAKRFCYLQQKLRHFEARWKKEYLVDLREFHKNRYGNKPSINIGDVVLLQEENRRRHQWKIGRIDSLILGQDGIARGAKVVVACRGKTEILHRPVQRLFPLEVSKYDVKNNVDRTNENENENVNAQPVKRTQRAADAQWKTRAMLDP